MKPLDLLPEVLQRLVRHLLGGRQLERLDLGLPRHDERVAVGAEGCRDHLGHSDPGLRGHQRRQRLVLDLLQPPDRGAARRIAVGEETPAPRQPLGVLSVATEHPCLEGTTFEVVADELRGAHVLLQRRCQVVNLDPECEHGGAHLLGRRHAGGRAERDPHDRADAQAERQRSQRRGRKRGAEHDGAQGRERDEPSGDHAGPANELGARRDDDRRRGSEAELGVAPAREQVTLDRQPIGLDDTPQNRTGSQEDHRPDEQIACQTPAATQQDVEDDHCRKCEQSHERRAPQRACPPEDRRQRLGDGFVVLRRRPCDHRCQPDDNRRHEQEHRVDRPPVPTTRLGRCQQREVPGSLGRPVLAHPGSAPAPS